jgi:DNA-binding Xre family transcriptional regulator
MKKRNTKLAHLLLSKGLTSKTVAQSIEIRESHLSQIKNGKQNFTIDTLRKLCNILKCSPNDILDWEIWIQENNEFKDNRD